MASGLFNPTALLLVTPLVSSTCTLWFSTDQDYFLKVFTRPAVPRAQANALLPAYVRTWFGSGPWRVVSLLGITTWTTVAGLVLHRPLLRARGALGWFAWGAALTLGHLAYVPAVAWKLKWVMDDETEAKGTDGVGMLGRWLVVNRTRIVTNDFPAWVCYLVGVMKLLAV